MRILGKRPDGYHEISTTLQTISLHDDLFFETVVGGNIFLFCDQSDIPAGEDNLVVQAAAALKNNFSINLGARVRLHKRIPTKAGLGGGSSNAAVTLLALNRLWEIGASTAELEGLAGSIGADVPFFLHGGFAMATGTGTEITTLPERDPAHLIVLHPRASVSTAEAYKALNSPALTSNNAIPILAGSPGVADFSELSLSSAREWQNDFELTIFEMEPEIKRAKSALILAGAENALLAGSGASVFGIFSDRETQQRALNEIQLETGWRVFDCVTVSRREYARALSL